MDIRLKSQEMIKAKLPPWFGFTADATELLPPLLRL